jgi:hypothetical protein
LVLSIAFLEEKGGVKAAYTGQHGSSGSSGGCGDAARTPGRQQRRLSKKRQLDSGETPLVQPQQQQQQQQQGLLSVEGAGGTGGASGGGRKRRRISSTAAAHDSRATGAVAGAGGAQAQTQGVHADAGSTPAAVYGWGVDEGPREFSCRTRRRLLLYLKVCVGGGERGGRELLT